MALMFLMIITILVLLMVIMSVMFLMIPMALVVLMMVLMVLIVVRVFSKRKESFSYRGPTVCNNFPQTTRSPHLFPHLSLVWKRICSKNKSADFCIVLCILQEYCFLKLYELYLMVDCMGIEWPCYLIGFCRCTAFVDTFDRIAAIVRWGLIQWTNWM